MLLGSERAPASTARVALVAAALVLALAGIAVLTSGVAGGTTLAVDGTDRVAELDTYGASGAAVVGYDHGSTVTVRFAVRNRGVLPVTVEQVDAFPEPLGLLTTRGVTVGGQPPPVRLAAGAQAEVAVTARFDHCEYYTERAVNRFDHARVSWRTAGFGHTSAIAYPDELIVRSPTIVGCPDRVLDRSAKQRSEDATITGRG
jgi:hypothetical protein